jgi:lipid-A-disaccharide synthase
VGDKMIDAGCKKLWHIDQANVMGLSEVVNKLPSLLRLRNSIVKYFSDNKPDVFIGVDSPDFNFTIEQKLKQRGIKTVHFISPSVWAWRSNRIKKIKASTDLMLCLFPFEVDFYKKHGQKSLFVGHPLTEKLQPRQNYKPSKKVLLMPGSREAEIKSLLPELLSTVNLMRERDSTIQFSLALANENFKEWVQDQIHKSEIELSVGDAYAKIAQSDLVIVASGTATLEIALLGVPMVVVYKLSGVSYQIVKRLLRTNFISLPNVILGKEVIPELIQENANGKNIANIAMQIIVSNNLELVSELRKIHTQLHQESSAQSAKAILEFVNE